MSVKQTVFLVDDDPAVAKAVSRLLRASGYTVEMFTSAREFTDRFGPDSTGCLILDLTMPGMNGLELQRWLTSRNSSLPIFFLTGSDDLLKDKPAIDGATEILTKPVIGNKLLSAVERALAKSRGSA